MRSVTLSRGCVTCCHAICHTAHCGVDLRKLSKIRGLSRLSRFFGVFAAERGPPTQIGR